MCVMKYVALKKNCFDLQGLVSMISFVSSHLFVNM
jgi:hypothetical protein